jgi:hypothetical protein
VFEALPDETVVIAGTMVRTPRPSTPAPTGVALGVLVHPGFLAIATFFGARLTFAAATRTCGLGLLLLRMPWNRPRSCPPAGRAAPAEPRR